ncbi:MAG: EamA family transporter [Gammaproteobacteria bacterium]|nr:EamA family transporter [Gammaproteobacteria bacterium]
MSLLYSVINHIDHGLLQRYFKHGGVEVLLLFSSLFASFGIPYAIYMEPDVLSIGGKNVVIMLVVAILNTTLLYCYLKAMEKDEPTVVILYYQLLPVFALAMGYVILGETISQTEMIAMGVVLTGTTLASFKRNNAKELQFRWRTAGLMIIATTCWAAEVTMGKIVILEESVYHSIFWESVLMAMLGVCILVAKPDYRHAFKAAWKMNSKVILCLMLLSEAIYSAGNALSAHATELKEVSIVMLSQPTQTIFVFVLGTVLAFIFPRIYTQKLTSFDLVQKLVAIAITTCGSYLLLL